VLSTTKLQNKLHTKIYNYSVSALSVYSNAESSNT